jgi:hypothetical protein
MPFGRFLITAGVLLVAVGLLLQLAPGLRLGRLPGDFSFGGGNGRVFVPLGTSLLLSIVLTLVLSLFARR